MVKDDEETNGDEVVTNGDVYRADDIADLPLAAEESNHTQTQMTIDGPSLITDKMSVFMVSLVFS